MGGGDLDHTLLILLYFWMLMLMICSLCDYVWGVSAGRSSPTVVLRTISVDLGQLLGSYFGTMESLGESRLTILGVMLGVCISDRVLGVFFWRISTLTWSFWDMLDMSMF